MKALDAFGLAILTFALGYILGFGFSPIQTRDCIVLNPSEGVRTSFSNQNEGKTLLTPQNLISLVSFSAPEKPSPGDWIGQDKIKVYNDKVIISIEKPEWARFTNTNSMDPVLDETANAIQIVPKNPDQIQVGDIASYKPKGSDETIIHRVIGKGNDEEGVFFILKGDNNPSPDPERVRFEQIQRVLVAIIY